MKFISNCDEAATAKPRLAGDPTHREATYSTLTRLQDHSSCHRKCTATTRGQVHFPTISIDLFPENSGYTQNLNHHISTTSINVADVSKVQDSKFKLIIWWT